MLRTKEIVDRVGSAKVVKETLSDGSFVYNVEIGNVEIPCRGGAEAYSVACLIEKLGAYVNE